MWSDVWLVGVRHVRSGCAVEQEHPWCQHNNAVPPSIALLLMYGSRAPTTGWRTQCAAVCDSLKKEPKD
jgi:hypothetical protein